MQDQDIVYRLRLYAERMAATRSKVQGLLLHHAADEIKRLRAERDEARQEWCRLWGHTQGRNVAPTQAARLRAWDCFRSKVADTK